MAAKLCTLTQAEREQLRAAVAKAEEALADLGQLAADILSEWEIELDGKSERWEESDVGKDTRDRFDEFAAWVEELPDADGISLPPGVAP